MIKMSERGEEQSENQNDELRELFLGIMEGYNDSAIPPLSYFSTPEIPNNEEKIPNSNKREITKSGRLQNRKRQRDRSRMDQLSDNYSLLQPLVPSLLNAYKPSKEKILTDTVNYIKYLEQEAKRLELQKKSQSKLQKMEMPVLSKCTNHSSVNVTISDSATFIVLELPFRRGAVLVILKVLAKHRAEVLEARIDVSDEKMMTFTATLKLGGSSIDKIRQDILTSLDLSY